MIGKPVAEEKMIIETDIKLARSRKYIGIIPVFSE